MTHGKPLRNISVCRAEAYCGWTISSSRFSFKLNSGPQYRQLTMKPIIPIPLTQKVKLVFFAFVSPSRFRREEAEYNERVNRKHLAETASEPDRLSIIRCGLWQSFKICLGSAAFGAVAGFLLSSFCPTYPAIGAATGIVGAATLLWATLGVQGWNIQAFKGQTLSEQLNQWVYRSLYLVGTFLVALGSIWATV